MCGSGGWGKTGRPLRAVAGNENAECEGREEGMRREHRMRMSKGEEERRRGGRGRGRGWRKREERHERG
eukprot:767036-Rhodomonas_salina.1